MNASDRISHEQATRILPWLINNSLPEAERARVYEHASACLACRRELDKLELLQQSINRDSSSVPQADMRAINSRIDALIERNSRGRLLLARLQEFFGSPWRVAFVAQSAALLSIAAIAWWPDAREVPFRTLTQPQVLPQGESMRAVFSPDLTEVDLGILLDELRLGVIAGPSDRGVYTLAFADGSTSPEREAILVSLRGNPHVLFAQAVNRGDGQ